MEIQPISPQVQFTKELAIWLSRPNCIRMCHFGFSKPGFICKLQSYQGLDPFLFDLLKSEVKIQDKSLIISFLRAVDKIKEKELPCQS